MHDAKKAKKAEHTCMDHRIEDLHLLHKISSEPLNAAFSEDVGDEVLMGRCEIPSPSYTAVRLLQCTLKVTGPLRACILCR